MGLLDDAIRQHLELKRRHGADPSDVAKLEREAFGPSERPEPIVAFDDAAEAGDARGDLAVAEEQRPVPEAAADDSGSVALEPEAAEPLDAPADEAARPPDEAARPPDATPSVDAPEIEPEPPAAAAPAAEPEPPVAEPDPPPPTGGSVRADDVGDRTVEFSAFEPEPEPDPQPDAEPGEQDELEQTPEFLEETPEHDRLWFEQKPPKDFDF